MYQMGFAVSLAISGWPEWDAYDGNQLIKDGAMRNFMEWSTCPQLFIYFPSFLNI
jgi:hypothetical protein